MTAAELRLIAAAAIMGESSQPVSGLPVASLPLFNYDRIMKEKDVVQSLAALAQPVRLQVFRALVVRGSTGLTPGTMSEALNIPANTLSFHLKELTHAGLVTQERASRNIIYRAAYGRMNALLGYLSENCCRGAECGVEATADSSKC